MRTLLSLCLLLTTGYLSAQLSIERELVGAVFTTSSLEASDNELRIDASAGEPIIGIHRGEIVATVGFHQTGLLEIESMDEENLAREPFGTRSTRPIGVVAFPNPIVDELSVDLGPSAGRFETLQVFDQFGRLMMEQDVNDRVTVNMDPVGTLPAATYYLRGVDAEGNAHHLTNLLVVTKR